MNKTKIDYGDYCWNPYEGCLKGCWYCWAKKGKDRLGGTMRPTYYPERLKDPMKQKAGRVLVCFWGDLFGDWVDKNFIERIINKTKVHPEHTFLFLTKNPQRYAGFHFPDNCWLGTSIARKEDYYRALTLLVVSHDNTNTIFLSIEPLMEDLAHWEIFLSDWIIIGGLTPKNIHKEEWVDKIIEKARGLYIPIFLKDNLHYPKKIQEFPRGESAAR